MSAHRDWLPISRPVTPRSAHRKRRSSRCRATYLNCSHSAHQHAANPFSSRRSAKATLECHLAHLIKRPSLGQSRKSVIVTASVCVESKMKQNMIRSFCLITALGFCASGAHAQASTNNLPMDRVYQGRIQLPDFVGRDKGFANFRTRISNEMRTGPNFAGHYAIVEIGCGTGCRFAFVGDVATGKMYQFPYGGEENYMLDLKYGVKSNSVSARWVKGENCYADYLEWNGTQFQSRGKSLIGPQSAC